MFRNIFTLTKKPALSKRCINAIVNYVREKYPDISAVVAPDTKGFVFATTVAWQLDLPFIPIRKCGKIPADSSDLIRDTYKNRKNKVELY